MSSTNRAIFFLQSVCFSLCMTSLVSACSFDTDCNPGSQCMKFGGSIYGVCAGGIFPGNSNDRQPVYSPLDPNQTTGKTCSFDTDCGPGSTCYKADGGAVYGVCMRQ